MLVSRDRKLSLEFVGANVAALMHQYKTRILEGQPYSAKVKGIKKPICSIEKWKGSMLVLTEL